MVRLFASDLDGTFLDTPRSASEHNLAAVRACEQHDVRFVFATGRPSRWLGDLGFLRVGHPLAITSNGGAVVDLVENRVLRDFPCDPDAIRSVVADIRSTVPGAGFILEYGSWCAAEPGVPRSDFIEESIEHGEVDDMLRRDSRVHKLLVRTTELDTEQLFHAVQPLLGDRLTATYSYLSPTGVLEMSAPNVSKATTLALLCDEWGIDAADVVAFGDMPNDLDMLTWAGRGYAMPGAHPLLTGPSIEKVDGDQADAVGRIVESLLR